MRLQAVAAVSGLLFIYWLHPMRPIDAIISSINNLDVQGVYNTLIFFPEVIEAQNEDHATPLFYFIDYWLRFESCSFTDYEKKALFAIGTQLLRQPDVDVNVIVKEKTPLIMLLEPAGSLKGWFNALMNKGMKKFVKRLLARPDFDVSVQVCSFEINAHQATLSENIYSAVDVLNSYKILGMEKYKRLLRLFFHMHPHNQQSWHVILPLLVGLQDFEIMQYLHKKLEQQSWLCGEPCYPLLTSMDALCTYKLLSPGEAKAFLKKEIGDCSIYAVLKPDSQRKVAYCFDAYRYAKSNNLRDFGKYMVRYMQSLANCPQDVGAVIASFSRVD